MGFITADKTIQLDPPTPRHAVDCPVEEWLSFLGHRWNALILWHLQSGPRRNGELTALLPGIGPKVLSERLNGLERRKLVSRSPIAVFPRGVAYSLSTKGKDLVVILDQLEFWARFSDAD
ncbi:helix-turn-helix transcriptional regulator [Microvirga sp. ACRRW]|uniref:winged helix-turn-helix transcriptional regulator n=1 Tax=Microvirga sp. ACRRW TaxID=2918205 RepID=UPI001EF5BFF2|nr:helix-turn-helix domain-containing protein [Microvirga sp. ACRRW]MCG7392695.1 helix-turn-helix transcriptional regulator [Microvirga sp. ACRRW]